MTHSGCHECRSKSDYQWTMRKIISKLSIIILTMLPACSVPLTRCILLSVYARTLLRQGSHMYARHTTTQSLSSSPSPLPPSFYLNSSPGFEPTTLHESDTPFLTYVLRSGYFITTTRSVIKRSRGWILNWPPTPTTYMCAHVFLTPTGMHTHHY